MLCDVTVFIDKRSVTAVMWQAAHVLMSVAASEHEPRTAIIAHVHILRILGTYLRHDNACVHGAGVQSDLGPVAFDVVTQGIVESAVERC